MRWLSILPFAVAGSAAIAPREATYKVVEKDVVVIGGGASGTYAATRLLGEGKSVVVLEKEDHLGGHTVTYTDPDTKQHFNLGVVVYHNSTLVQGYFQSLGVQLHAADLPGTQSYYDFSTGKSVKGFKPTTQASLGAALVKYSEILKSTYPYLALGYDVPAPVPKELLEPYSKFIEKHGVGELAQLVNTLAGCNGNLLNRPAIYGIKTLGLLLIQAMSQTGFVNAKSGDNLDLYRAAQGVLAKTGGLVLNAKVHKVTRSSSGVTMLVNTPTGPITVKAKKLIIAIPPLKKYLQAIGLDLTAEEASIFGRFTGYLYGSAVFSYSNFKKGLYNIGSKAPYYLPSLPGTYTMSPLAGKKPTNKVATYFGGLDPTMSETKVKDVIKGELSNLAKAGSIGYGTPDFKFYESHAPFHIHVQADDIKNGFYGKLYALNGKKNTFYTGAAFVDNDSTLIWTWTESYLLPLIKASFKSGKAGSA